MLERAAAMALTIVAVAATASAQATKPPAKAGSAKPATYDITITTESVYTGTMQMVTSGGKVTGDLRLTSPTEITGKVAGTSKAGVLALDFPYFMTERKCTGNVKMSIKMPAKPGPASGTMEAVGCGREESRPLTGTVEHKPAAAAAKPAPKNN